MIDREDECAHNNKGDPKGYIDHIQSSKIKTNRTRNNVEIDHSRDEAAPRLRFLFFLLLIS